MPRKGSVPRREAVADPKYDSVLVTRFINAIMSDGKRSIAEGHFYKAMAIVERRGIGGEDQTLRREACARNRAARRLDAHRDAVFIPVAEAACAGGTTGERAVGPAVGFDHALAVEALARNVGAPGNDTVHAINPVLLSWPP